MCACLSGARAGLLLCSITLMLIALTCIAGGVVLVIGRVIYDSQLDFLRESLASSAAAIRGKNDLDVSGLDVAFITVPLGVTLIIFGLLIATVCILGIIAASCRFYKFIIVYASLLSCLFFTEIVVIICAYVDRKPFDTTVKNFLKLSLSSYTEIEGVDSFTLGWNGVMSYFRCCGVDSYIDFLSSGYPKSVSSVSPAGPITIVTPQICCIDKTKAAGCAQAPNYVTDTYHDRGCYQHMWDFITTETKLIIFAVYFIVLFEYLSLFFAIWLVCLRRSQGVTKVGHYDRQN